MLFRGITYLSVCLSVLLTAVFGGFSSLSWLYLVPAWFAGAWVVLFLLAFGFFAAACSVIDVNKPQERDSRFYRVLSTVYIEAIVTLAQVRIHAQGLEKTPKEGRFLLVCNHLDNPDPGVLLHCFPHSQLAFISKRENQTMPVVGKLMHKLMCQLINRENDREALKTILRCIQIIKDDEASIAVFPEGYAKPEGYVHHFRNGVFKIAQKTEVPIVVCTLKNTQHVIHNALHLRPTDVTMHLVDVIQPEQYKGMTTVDLGNMVYEMMIADMGEEFRAPAE